MEWQMTEAENKMKEWEERRQEPTKSFHQCQGKNGEYTNDNDEIPPINKPVTDKENKCKCFAQHIMSEGVIWLWKVVRMDT